MKFASFETVVEMIYHRLPGQKSDYSKGAQTGVAFTGGYIAGILCAIISHPADVMVSKLNTSKQAGEGTGAAVARIYKDIGFGGLWNGLPVRWVSSFYCLRKTQDTDNKQHCHDRYSHRPAMDDLRLVQDLHGLPDHWRREVSQEYTTVEAEAASFEFPSVVLRSSPAARSTASIS